MRRALVILGDPEIGHAIANGATTQTYQLDPKRGVRAATGFKDWSKEYYGIFERHGFWQDYHAPNIICQKLLLAWALMWAGIFECYKRLSAWNRQA